MEWNRVLRCCGLLVLALTAAFQAHAAETNGPENPEATCVVPSQRPTIQEAVDDPTCTTIQIQAGAFEEIVTIDRSLTMAGAGTDLTTITGQVVITGTGVVVLITDLTIDTTGPQSAGCFSDAMSVLDGAEGLAIRVSAINSLGDGYCRFGPIFADGFETGNTGQWSNTVGTP